MNRAKEGIMATGEVERTIPLSEVSSRAEVRDLMALRVSHNKILETKKLPSLPTIAYRLLELLSGDPDIAQLEELLRYDQALTAKILSVANSAYVGLHQEVDTLQRAIVLLGVKEVSEIAFSICIASVIKPLKNVYTFEIKEFWIHSVAVGLTSRIIAQSLDFENEDFFFTLGLLHDLGRLVLLHLFPEAFEEILIKQQESEKDLLSVETEMGLAHTWLGRWLVKRWELPPSFELAVRFHHHPFHKGQFLPLAGVIKLADLTVHNLGLSNLPGAPKSEIGPLLQMLGLEEELYLAIQDHLRFIRETLLDSWSAFL